MILNLITQGSCPEALYAIPDGFVDLIITSPPYADARAKQYGGPPPDKYVEWYLPIAKELKRILKPTGSYVLNIKERILGGQRSLYVYDLVAAHVREAGLRWHDEIIWAKPNGLPIGRQYLVDRWEHCYWFTAGADPYIDRTANRLPLRPNSISRRTGRPNNARYNSGFGLRGIYAAKTVDQAPTTVLSIGTGRNPCNHPAIFPLDLPAWFCRFLSRPGDIVLDPFMGSGTTAVAAEREGRRWIGIERSAEYCAKAEERLRQDRAKCKDLPAELPAGQGRLKGGKKVV